jgi:uncharacterized protein YndB with AHSA1/START domain
MTEAGLGTLERHGEQCVLTFTRDLDHPPEKVWRAVSEPDHLAAWFPHEMVGERKAGAPLKFVFNNGDSFDGEMLVYEPPRLIEFMWGADRIRIELQAVGTGTRLILVDTFDELGKAARDAAGWHECLDRLAAHLDGAASPTWGDVWRAVHPRYVDALGAEAATIGPPEGHEP